MKTYLAPSLQSINRGHIAAVPIYITLSIHRSRNKDIWYNFIHSAMNVYPIARVEGRFRKLREAILQTFPHFPTYTLLRQIFTWVDVDRNGYLHCVELEYLFYIFKVGMISELEALTNTCVTNLDPSRSDDDTNTSNSTNSDDGFYMSELLTKIRIGECIRVLECIQILD
uniref:EF-hand domain-containing protein n=1 Tax=Lygus hesperus TaxID=30085 RepID=A0A146LFP2_LYGHE